MSIWLKATEDPSANPDGPTHQALLASVQADIVKVRDDFSKHADPATDVHDCADLGKDTASMPISSTDDMVTANMNKAETSLHNASENCGRDDTFAGEFNRGIEYFTLAISRIKSLVN